ncbi:MAG: methylcrotonoyl-CoA carboxylase [Pseudomonadales bacterium]|nr:methylcrotonoyl-CoA carboxylase [Pseudomonadales bacterium]
MNIIESKVSPTDDVFLKRKAHNLGLRNALHEKKLESRKWGEKQKKLHLERGKILARDRIDLLIDLGTPFLELGELAGDGLYENVPPGAGIVTGIGRISGVTCMIIANDATVKGGTYYGMTCKKHVRAQKIAWEHRIPTITLVDSGGGNLPDQANIFPDAGQFGSIFNQQIRMSAEGIPQITVVHGACTAGGAYIPAVSDISIIVREQGYMHLAGPELTFAATGEDVDRETLGGAEMHCSVSGVTDYLAENDAHAIAIARQVIDDACNQNEQLRPVDPPKEPRYNPEELYGIISDDLKKPTDMYEVLARLLDDSRFDEFKALYGDSILCGYGHIHGFKVGVIANQGVIFSDSSKKAVHFMQLCCKHNIPLLYLADNTGFMVGKEAEHNGITKDGAKFFTAMASANVPKYNIILGKSYGAGYMGMCGRPFEPQFCFGWPNGKAALMGPEQAAMTLAMVQRQKREREGLSWSEAEEQDFKAPILEEFDRFATMNNYAANLWIDNVLDPVETRAVMGLLLDCASRVPFKETPFGVFRM